MSSSIPTFKSIDAYESYVRTSEAVTRAPAVRAKVAADRDALGKADQALSARKSALGYDTLVKTRDVDAAKLDAANHPMRAQAQAIQAQIPALTTQSASLQDQIIRLQSEITNLQTQRTATIWDNSSSSSSSLTDALVGAALQGAAIGAQSLAISGDQKKIQDLVGQKARIDTDIMTKTMTATTLANQPGAPEDVKPFKDAFAKSARAVADADTTLAPLVGTRQSAQQTLDADTADQNRLADERRTLADYDKSFSGITRTQLWWQDHGWKKKLDGFWQSLGQ